jgi:hypothetical protein
MTLKPTDMLEIQTAIDEYERKFPRRPAPTAEVALAWRLGKREWARRQAAAQEESDPVASLEENPDSVIAQQECNRLVWAWEQARTWCFSADLPWVKGALRIGLWGVVAVLVASVFFFGAIVGGFK